MKQKELEIILSKFRTFDNPKIKLEQYQTPPRLVAMITYRAFMLGDIENKIVCDYCSGTGLFGIAAKLLGAKKVYAIEIDKEAIEIAKENAKTVDVEIDFIHKDVSEFTEKVDTVLMNSPFGIKGEHKDQVFLLAALRNSSVSYSMHLSQEKNEEFLRRLVQKQEKEVNETIKAEFEIPRTYKFHKKRHHIIEVIIIRCS
ncbi:MAG: METTL5 family protein [Candidatus Heimdallarchaeaceae archaeon]